MTEQNIRNLELDLEDCIVEAIKIGAAPDERFAIEIIDGKIFYYHGTEIPEEFETDCYAYGTIPDVELDEDDYHPNVRQLAKSMIKKAFNKKVIDGTNNSST
ncbi:MAG: hypothetical protein SAK29_37615 [Scytonema sp. PMC 1069.18]|nr:hypothetical protein [Scytonema sp. PMC 1069.18]MEC4884980.1 hypothetical protein [Scytonema sp. PMC 1070.18]